MAPVLLAVLYMVGLSSFGFVSAAVVPTCSRESFSFVFNLRSQCPLSIPQNPSIQVDGNFLDRALASNQRNGYISVLFYASWCPFSLSIRPKFEMLGSMFPQMEHLSIEQSSALPSVFSRYGIHSLPSILIFNQTSKEQYHGPKTLQSLVEFYKKTTGLEPVQYLVEDMPTSLESSKVSIMQGWDAWSLEEMLKEEPYLVLAILFLSLRMLILAYRKMLAHLKAFYGSYVPQFNLEIFDGTSQLFGRVLQMIDVRRIWTKLRLCKTRNFHEGAKNCRVWASSLASVSLGESSLSSARS